MSDRLNPLLRLMLTIVPAAEGQVRRGHYFPSIYDTMIEVLETYGSDDQREWADLAQVCRQEMARLRAAEMAEG